MLLNLVLWALFGALAGWIAGQLMGSQNGLIVNIILGIVGALVGGFVASLIGFNTAEGLNLVSLLIAVAGACLVIWLARLVRR